MSIAVDIIIDGAPEVAQQQDAVLLHRSRQSDWVLFPVERAREVELQV